VCSLIAFECHHSHKVTISVSLFLMGCVMVMFLQYSIASENKFILMDGSLIPVMLRVKNVSFLALFLFCSHNTFSDVVSQVHFKIF
jgi:hypothetical protein